MNRRGFLKALGLAPVAAVVAAAPAEIAVESIVSAAPNVTSDRFLRGDATWGAIDVLWITNGRTGATSAAEALKNLSPGYVTVNIGGVEHYLPCL